MRNFFVYAIGTLIVVIQGCKVQQHDEQLIGKEETASTDFIITFGSCNKHDSENVFWDVILAQNPDAFIWGGDIVYADTDEVAKIAEHYKMQNAVPAYAKLKEETMITGTWDDHDYGLNDGGSEFVSKRGSQQVFLDFMGVPTNDIRRTRDGVYSSQLITKPSGSVKIINLDTRYFRSVLTKDDRKGRRYRPSVYGEGTILGEQQWSWLKNELENSKADFNLIVTSIQFLSNEHGFEKWANHPHEVDRLKDLIVASDAKGVVLLSGDRHISEFSKMEVKGMSYPLIDFTSSGLTHSYSDFKEESNPYRVGKVIAIPSFGMVTLNIKAKTAKLKIMGRNGKVLQELKQVY